MEMVKFELNRIEIQGTLILDCPSCKGTLKQDTGTYSWDTELNIVHAIYCDRCHKNIVVNAMMPMTPRLNVISVVEEES